MPIINTLPNTIANGQLEDAVPVMANFNWILSQVNGNACPSTSGSAILKGNGTGGTISAVAGTDYAGITSVNTFTQIQSGVAATAAANFPITSQVQASEFNTGTIGGTVDAITATFAPVFTALASAPVWWRAAGANTSTTPTFKRDGLVAKTIVKGANHALVAGDIPGAGAWMCSQYDATLDKEVLLNPAYPVSIPSATTTQLGVVTKATPAEDAAGTGTGVVASADLPVAVGKLACGPTWTNVTASRAFGSTYTNNNAWPLDIAVEPAPSASTITISANINSTGAFVIGACALPSGNAVAVGHVRVPPGATYVITQVGGSGVVSSWWEL